MNIELKVGDKVVVWVGLEFSENGYEVATVTEVAETLKVNENDKEYEVVWCERFKAWMSKDWYYNCKW